LNRIGNAYKTDKKQYEKSIAWYLLATMENNTHAQNNIGILYKEGEGVPKNYLCALKWLLKSAEGSSHVITLDHIGELFENGCGVPLDKYKAIEWYSQGKHKTNINRLKGEGHHLSAANKSKFNSITDSLY
jgi:TPR repeat protein